MDHPVLHFTILGDENHEHALGGQADEVELAQRHGLVAPPQGDQPRQLGDFRKQVRGVLQQLFWIIFVTEPVLKSANLCALQRAHRQQSIDKYPVTTLRRYPPSGCMGRAHQSHFFQVGEDITNRGGTQLQSRLFRQGARAHWLPLSDIALNQGLQKKLSTGT